MKRILFIGHDASRTGAPMVLLHYLQWLRSNDASAEIDLLLLTDGPLTDDYRSVANVHILDPRGNLARRAVRRFRRIFLSTPAFKAPEIPPFTKHYDLVLGNTVVTLEMLEHFHRKGITTACWVHEMPYVIVVFYETQRFLELIGNVDRLIVGSKAVEKALNKLGVDVPANVVYEFLTTDKKKIAGPGRAELKIPDGAFMVLGCGHFGWRKGVDIFLQVAERLTVKYADIYFVWIGGKGRGRDEYHELIMRKHDKVAAKERVVFTGELSEIGQLFGGCDIFALTSREDPFPLVCLLAADEGKPVICFEKAGGMPEFVGDDAGVVVPFDDADKFSDAIEEFYSDREKLRRSGAAAKAKLYGEFSAERSCEKLTAILDE